MHLLLNLHANYGSVYMKGAEKGVFISNVIRGSKYSLVSIVSFGMEEAILAFGLFLFGTAYIIPVNIAAVFFSVAFGFFANEVWTVRHEGDHSGMRIGIIIRLLKFEIIYAAGSALGVIVQLLIFYNFGINPVIANIGGALAAYPLNYVISLLYVWRIRVWKK